MLLPPLAQKLGQMVLKWSEMESRLEDEQNGGSWRSVGRFQKFYKNLDEWCRKWQSDYSLRALAGVRLG